MTYNISLTSGEPLVTIADNTVDINYTSLTLIGKNYSGYGQAINENFVRLLENFSNTDEPLNPLTGQIWYDAGEQVIKVRSPYNSWKSIGSTYTGSNEPTDPTTGDQWWDESAQQLKTWVGNKWTIIGPFPDDKINDIKINNVDVGRGGGSRSQNTRLGTNALMTNTTGNGSTAIGYEALISNSIGMFNTGIGNSALKSTQAGSYNTAIGFNAGSQITTGSKNVILGSNNGGIISTLSNNIILSDGDGNVRARCDSNGKWIVPGSAPSAESSVAAEFTGDLIIKKINPAIHLDHSGDVGVNLAIKCDGSNFIIFEPKDENREWFRIDDNNTSPGFSSAFVYGKEILDQNNFTKYTTTKTGLGALGTWGISVTGSAGSIEWTNVQNRPTDVGQFTNNPGYQTASGSVAYAITAGTANEVEWANVQNRPTDVGQFTNNPGYQTALGSVAYATTAGTANAVKWTDIINKPTDESLIGAQGYTGSIGFTGSFGFTGSSGISYGNGNILTNIEVGDNSLVSNTSGLENTAFGHNVLQKNTTGSRNVGIGYSVLQENISGEQNTFVGTKAGNLNTSGSFNVAVGDSAMENNLIGERNVAIGDSSLFNNRANQNTGLGYWALINNTTGKRNTAVGDSALSNNTTGSQNTAIGYGAGISITTGSNNVVIGANNGASIATLNNNIILSDGNGNIKAQVNDKGQWDFRDNRITYLSKSGHNYQAMIKDGVLYTTSGTNSNNANFGTGRGNGLNIYFGLDNFHPVRFPTLSKVKASGGNGYAVTWALLENGDLYTWGYNANGQCGLGHTTVVNYPTLSTTDVEEVYDHPSNGDIDVTHSRLFIKKLDGKIYGCGYNAYGALGIGNTTTSISSWTMLQVSNVKKLFNLGSAYGCVIIWTTTSLLVAGYNGYGQLGTNTTTTVSTLTNVANNWFPTLAGNFSDLVDIHATGGFGYYVTTTYYQTSVMMLFKTSSRTLIRCCGDNTWGQLGTGDATRAQIPVTPTGLGTLTFEEIAVFGGGPATVYARTSNNELYTWGYNGFGQIGRSVVSVPANRPGIAMSNIKKLHCDGLTSHTYSYHSQGFVVDTLGHLWSAGFDGAGGGYLGDGTFTQTPIGGSFRRVHIPWDERVDDVGHYCTTSHGRIILAKTESGNVYGWGYNAHAGLVVSASYTASATPSLIKMPDKKVDLTPFSNALPVYTYRINSSTIETVLNLKTKLMQLGWDGASDFESFTIYNEGIIGSDSSANYSLDTGADWPTPTASKNQIKIINTGHIVGRGGAGSTYIGYGDRWDPAYDGGPAIIARTQISIDNTNGTIAKGGGGGWSTYYPPGYSNSGLSAGGGGGAGYPPGRGGGAGRNATGLSGTLTTGGTTGDGAGPGKDLGIPGFSETEKNGVKPTITGDKFITWINKGNLLGPIVTN